MVEALQDWEDQGALPTLTEIEEAVLKLCRQLGSAEGPNAHRGSGCGQPVALCYPRADVSGCAWRAGKATRLRAGWRH